MIIACILVIFSKFCNFIYVICYVLLKLRKHFSDSFFVVLPFLQVSWVFSLRIPKFHHFKPVLLNIKNECAFSTNVLLIYKGYDVEKKNPVLNVIHN